MFRDREFVNLLPVAIPFADVFIGTKFLLEGHTQGLILYGHHSLIRWRLVIHGGIDGYSRMVVYLHCSTNNRAESVFNLFWKASRLYGVPSRVRSDKGGENIDVCRFMVSQRGIGRGSFIVGSSTHNQRIERLWRDVYRCVAATYHEVFFYMEDEGMLDPDVDIDLHCVFLPIIN